MTTERSRGTAPTRHGRRRWPRFAAPVVVAFTVIVMTAVFHGVEEPDRTDPAYLSPASASPMGAADLASLLRTRGITVRNESRTSDALLAAYQGNATLFIPTPGLIHWRYLEMVALMPATTRVVLVEPSPQDLRNGRVPVDRQDTAWATLAPPPTASGQPCAIAGTQDAGRAAVTRSRYASAAALTCYEQGLARVRLAETEIIVVGSGDLFRNDRISEFDNATLATGLLATRPTVVWLDLHGTEPGPLVDHNAAADGTPMPPSLRPGSGPGGGGGDGAGSDPEPASPPPGVEGPEPGAAEPDVWNAFPAWLWASVVGTLLILLLLALSAARRLGRPVAEPLPISVRGAETILGRARLYQRAAAIMTTLDAVRRDLVPKIAIGLGLPGGTPPEVVAATAATRLGLDEADAADAITGTRPNTPKDLVRLARALADIHDRVQMPRPETVTSSDDEGDHR